MIPPESQRPTETERVEAWRLEQLLKAGYPLEHAEPLASQADVDLHQAVELLEHGCPPDTAAAVLL